MAQKKFTNEDAKEYGMILNIGWHDFDVDQFCAGLNVELEHGLIDPETNVTNDDPLVTAKIALAHLKEIPDYYTRLEEMEQKAESNSPY